MDAVFKTVLSMSASGTLLILLLLAARPLIKNRFSRQWQYYVWLVVVLRLLLPVGPPTSLMGRTYQALDRLPGQPAAVQQQPADPPATAGSAALPQTASGSAPAQGQTGREAVPGIGIGRLAGQLWMVWLAGALGMLLYKITCYQNYMRYLAAGAEPVSRPELLNSLSLAAQKAGVGRPVELCSNPLAGSPMMAGLLRPRIILPDKGISPQNLYYTALHELTHYKRCDLLYKWLVQCAVCLHWYNPFVHLMARQMALACEFACDEAVLAKAGQNAAAGYGKTLLDAAAAAAGWQKTPGPAFLTGGRPVLKERLNAVLNPCKRGKGARLTAAVLTACFLLCGVFTGVYSAAGPSAAKASSALNLAPAGRRGVSARPDAGGALASAPEPAGEGELAQRLRQYYEAGSLPLFEIALADADSVQREGWMQRAYQEDEIGFFSICARQADQAQREQFAKTAYEDGAIAYFSALADGMGEQSLAGWLQKALEDGRWDFEAMLYDRLGQSDEKDALEETLDAAQREEYRAAGILWEDDAYWYGGQRVRVFLDARQDRSFYTLNIDPEGTADLRVLRDAAGHITGAEYLTQAELEEWLDEDFAA